jgi:hypothetical protein
MEAFSRAPMLRWMSKHGEGHGTVEPVNEVPAAGRQDEQGQGKGQREAFKEHQGREGGQFREQVHPEHAVIATIHLVFHFSLFSFARYEDPVDRCRGQDGRLTMVPPGTPPLRGLPHVDLPGLKYKRYANRSPIKKSAIIKMG